MKNKYVFVTDKQYETALKNGISKNTVYQRVHRGWDVERAINQPTMDRKESWKTNFKNYSVIPKWVYEKAKDNGINKSTLINRISNLGWDMEEACTRKALSLGERRNKKSA